MDLKNFIVELFDIFYSYHNCYTLLKYKSFFQYYVFCSDFYRALPHPNLFQLVEIHPSKSPKPKFIPRLLHPENYKSSHCISEFAQSSAKRSERSSALRDPMSSCQRGEKLLAQTRRACHFRPVPSSRRSV